MYVQCLHVCLDFIRRTTQPGHNRFFLIPPKNLYSNQATQKNTCQIFVPQKIPESKISNPKKSFDHPRQLKSRVPPLGSMYYFVRKVAEFCWVFSFVEVCTKLNLRNLSVKMTEASNCTELEQVVHTHRTLCQSDWPLRAGLPKSQSSLLNISFHFGDTCSHCTKVWHRTYPIWNIPLSRSERYSFAPCRNRVKVTDWSCVKSSSIWWSFQASTKATWYNYLVWT